MGYGLLHMLAKKIGVDPLQLRLKSAVRRGTPMHGQVLMIARDVIFSDTLR
jgi:hypothetical protein